MSIIETLEKRISYLETLKRVYDVYSEQLTDYVSIVEADPNNNYYKREISGLEEFVKLIEKEISKLC